MRSASLLALSFVVLAPLSVSADAIRRPQCPDGWESRRVGHSARCFPRTCTSDEQCGAESACREVRRCWARENVSQGRRRVDPPPRAWIPREELCPSEQCSSGECRAARECVPRARADRAHPRAAQRASVGCAVRPGPSDGSIATIFGLAFVAVMRRALRR